METSLLQETVCMCVWMVEWDLFMGTCRNTCIWKKIIFEWFPFASRKGCSDCPAPGASVHTYTHTHTHITHTHNQGFFIPQPTSKPCLNCSYSPCRSELMDKLLWLSSSMLQIFHPLRGNGCCMVWRKGRNALKRSYMLAEWQARGDWSPWRRFVTVCHTFRGKSWAQGYWADNKVILLLSQPPHFLLPLTCSACLTALLAPIVFNKAKKDASLPFQGPLSHNVNLKWSKVRLKSKSNTVCLHGIQNETQWKVVISVIFSNISVSPCFPGLYVNITKDYLRVYQISLICQDCLVNLSSKCQGA